MRPHTLDEMSTIILIFCRDGANKIELIEKCYLNDIELHFPRPHWLLFFLRQLPELRLLKFLNGNMSLIRVRIHEGLIYILQIVLDLIVRRADDRLEAKSADQ